MLFLNIGILFYLKYWRVLIGSKTLLLPLGISYYTLQAIGYFMDVYNAKIEKETNFAKFFLFISFFPQLIMGPINRYGIQGEQLKKEHKFDFENINEAIKKIEEEINEVLDVYKSNNREKIINEVGDLLFACVNVARLLNVDEEEALNKSTKKFVKRFNFIEESIVNQGKSLSESTIDEMNALWEDSKKYD